MQNCENLESKNHELNRYADDLNLQLEIERRKCRRLAEECEQRINRSANLSLSFKSDEAHNEDVSWTVLTIVERVLTCFRSLQVSMRTPTNANTNALEEFAQQMSNNSLAAANMDDSSHIELCELRVKYVAACERVTELEERIRYLNEEKHELNEKITSLTKFEPQELKSVHQELMW